MRANVLLSTCKSSKHTQHVSASLCGCGGLVEDDPAVDDDFEVDSEAMDVISFTFPFAMSCEANLFESITMPMLLGCVSHQR